MSDYEIVQVLSQYGEYFQGYDLVSYLLRSLGWILVKILYTLLEAVEGLLDDVYTLMGLLTSAPIKGFVQSFLPAVYLLFAFSFLVIGYNMIFGNKEGRKKIIPNFVLAIFCISSVFLMAANMSALTLAGVNWVRSTYTSAEESYSVADTLLKDNVVDLLYFVDHGCDGTNDIPVDMLGKINPAETIDPYKNDLNLSADERALFGNKLTITQSGQYQLQKIEKGGLLNWMPEYYFRFHIDFLPIYLMMIASIFVLFFTSFKVGRLIYELAIQEFFVVILAPSDLNSGRRISALIKSIGSGFFIIFVTAVLMKFFLIGSAYVNANMSGLTAAFCMIFMAWATVDGPNFIERIIGIDAGLSSGFKLMMSAYHGSRLATEAGKAAGSLIGAAGRGVAGLGGFAVGAAGAAGAAGAGAAKSNSNSIYNSQNEDQSEKNEQLGSSLYGDAQNNMNAEKSDIAQSQSSVSQSGDTIAGGDTGTGSSIYSDHSSSESEDGNIGDTRISAPDVIGGAETGSAGLDNGMYTETPTQSPTQDNPYVGGQDTDNLGNGEASIEDGLYKQDSIQDNPYIGEHGNDNLNSSGILAEGQNLINESKVMPEDSLYKDVHQPQNQKVAEANLKEKNPVPASKAATQGSKKTVVSSVKKGYAAGKKFREGVLRATGGEDRKK